jgi:hypothetical protein
MTQWRSSAFAISVLALLSRTCITYYAQSETVITVTSAIGDLGTSASDPLPDEPAELPSYSKFFLACQLFRCPTAKRLTINDWHPVQLRNSVD